MLKRVWPMFIVVALAIVAWFVWWSQDSVPTNPADTNTTVPVTYTSGSDNELVILHLNQTVRSSKFDLDLTLISPLAVETLFGTVTFKQVGDTQTIDHYQLRLASGTATSAQVVIIDTAPTSVIATE